MARVSKIFRLPLPTRMVSAADPMNLPPEFAVELQDLDGDRMANSLVLRRRAQQLIHPPLGCGPRYMGQIRLVPTSTSIYTATIAITPEEGTIFAWMREGMNDWRIYTPQEEYWQRIPQGAEALDISYGAIRTFGTDCGWMGRITPDEEQISHYQMFGGAYPVARSYPIFATPNHIIIDDGQFEQFAFELIGRDESHGYGLNYNVYYAISYVFEGGQESPLKEIGDINTSSIAHGGDAAQVVVMLRLEDCHTISPRVKKVRLYSCPSSTTLVKPLKDGVFRLVHEINLYEPYGTEGDPWFTVRIGQVQSVVVPGLGTCGKARIIGLNHWLKMASGDVPTYPNELYGDIWFEVEGEKFRVIHVLTAGETTSVYVDPADRIRLRDAVASGQARLYGRAGGRNRDANTLYPNARFWTKWMTYDTNTADITVYDDGQRYSKAHSYVNLANAAQDREQDKVVRRRGRIFGDAAFYWRVRFPDGSEDRRDLYFSTTNGVGLHCPDIILKANCIKMPFEIMGVAELGGYRMVIGDTGYAVGVMRTTSPANWDIQYRPNSRGCVAERTIVETGNAVYYLGRAGLYAFGGNGEQGPLLRDVIDEFAHYTTLSDAVMEYYEDQNSLILSIPAQDTDHPARFYLINLEDFGVRKMTVPESRAITGLARGLLGDILMGSVEGIARVLVRDEELTASLESATPTPVLETAAIHFDQEHPTAQQNVRAITLRYESDVPVLLTVKAYNPDQTSVITDQYAASAEGETAQIRLVLSGGLETAEAHSVRLEAAERYALPPGPTRFRIHGLWAEVVVEEDRKSL